MNIELHCPCCQYRFVASPDATDREVQERMYDEGPACALGDGNTFEDMIFTTIMQRGAIACPQCGEPVSVSEESLGAMAMEMLASF